MAFEDKLRMKLELEERRREAEKRREEAERRKKAKSVA